MRGDSAGTRTQNQWIKSPLLCQLSYGVGTGQNQSQSIIVHRQERLRKIPGWVPGDAGSSGLYHLPWIRSADSDRLSARLHKTIA